MKRIKIAEESLCVHMKPGNTEGIWKEWERQINWPRVRAKHVTKEIRVEAIPFLIFLAVGNMFSLKLEL